MADIPAKKMKTRHDSTCPVLGIPSILPQTVLPTYADTVRDDLKAGGATKDPAVADIAKLVAHAVEEVWYKASIPVISHKRICEKIRDYHDKYRNLKVFKGRQDNPQYIAKLNDFYRVARKKIPNFCMALCNRVGEMNQQKSMYVMIKHLTLCISDKAKSSACRKVLSVRSAIRKKNDDWKSSRYCRDSQTEKPRRKTTERNGAT